MPTVTDPDGKRRHVCDGACRRTCDHCLETISVHETWRWGLQSIGELQGGGGLTCLPCGHKLFILLHEGAPSKTEYDADE